jgi:acyl transferase domain-containing protein
VVSGKKPDLKIIEARLKADNILCEALPVSYGFHSTLIDPAKEYFLAQLQTLSLQKPLIPFISCASGHAMPSITRQHFWDVIRQPIHFQKTLQQCEQQNPAFYLDAGPAGTLTTFVKYNFPTVSPPKSFAVLTPFGQDMKNLENVAATVFSLN